MFSFLGRAIVTLARLKAKKQDIQSMRPVVSKLVDHLASYEEIVQVYLIGSLARGEYTEFSDIDLVVVYRPLLTMTDERSFRDKVLIERVLPEIPTDLHLMCAIDFEKEKSVGGLAWEAFFHGVCLFKRGCNDA